MSTDTQAPRVLHVVVGHGLPVYFRNAIKSVRTLAAGDQVLVIDNASRSEELRNGLREIAAADEQVDLILRAVNDVAVNGKVGSLYAAYALAFEYALERGYDLLHLMQADCQLLWWDDEVVQKACEIFTAHPRCVNIRTMFLSRHETLNDGLRAADDGISMLTGYGLTDTGLYHLGRWQAAAMRFDTAEQQHAKRYLADGFEVLCHPWPTDAPVPWPAVVRRGVQRGREVVTRKPFLLKPLPADTVRSMQGAQGTVWLEDACIPWGWVCLTPMWTTGLESADYWAVRFQDAKQHGLRHALPRLERRGVSAADRRWPLPVYRYRPSAFRLFAVIPLQEIFRRVGQLRGPAGRP